MTVQEIISTAAPAVAFVLGVANIIQIIARQKQDVELKVKETARIADEDRTKEIQRERTELFEENRTIKTDLRTDIERLKTDVADARKEALEARKEVQASRDEAADWKQKYDAEFKVNLDLTVKLDELRTEVDKLRTELGTVKTDAARESAKRGDAWDRVTERRKSDTKNKEA